MATDATGSPTPLGIPKFNTSADAPSGLGSNAQMDSLDTLIAARVLKPAGIVSGEAAVWNGSSWDRSTVTKIGASSLAAGITAPYRKTTAKQVVNTVTETDLLNGEITVAANAIGTTGVLRVTAFGDWKQGSGASTDVPRFKLKLGGTTILDSNVTGAATVAPSSATRLPWRIAAEIQNLGAANSQWTTLDGKVLLTTSANGSAQVFTTGEGDVWTEAFGAGTTIGARYFGVNSSAVDTTAGQALVLSVILPTANAACDITLKGAIVEII